MKILISRISDGTRGGAEVSAFDQARVLHDLGHDVLYVSNLPELKHRAEKLGIKTSSLPWIHTGKAPLRYILFWIRFPFFILTALRLVREFGPDIVNPHSREDQIAFTLTKRWHKKPVVWKDASDLRYQLQPGRKNPFGKFYEYFLKLAVAKADHIYLLQKNDLDNLVSIVGEEIKPRLSAIPSSILYSDYDLGTAPVSHPSDKLVVGYAGRVTEIKGLEYLLDAVRKLGNDGVEYWIYGDGGDYKKQLQEEAKDMPNIKFFSFDNNIPGYLKAFDIFAAPAPMEGWGRNVKEAMYFGLPVVGSDSGGIGMQIDDGVTGLLFTPHDSKDLADKLRRLIKDGKLRKQLGDRAKKKAIADGDFVTIVKDKILPIYEQFANQ